MSLLLSPRLFDADAATFGFLTSSCSFLVRALGLHNSFGDLLSDLMLSLFLLSKLFLDLNSSLPCGSKSPSISLPLSNGNAPHLLNFLHPQPSGNNDCTLPLLHSFPPDHNHSAVLCLPSPNRSLSLDPPLMHYSPAANDDHASVALTPEPDSPLMLSYAFVSCNNCSAPSCSSSQHNDPPLAKHMSPSSVSDILSTPGHGCTTSCHLSSSDNDQLSSSADHVCASDGDSSASSCNGSLSGPPVTSLLGRSSSPTGQNDKSTASDDHSSSLFNHSHPCGLGSAGSTDGDHS